MAQVTAPNRPALDTIVERFELKDASLIDAISQLSLEPINGLHLGMEEILRPKVSDPRDRSVRFSLDLRHTAVKDILEALCRLDQRYAWSADGQSINVYPQVVVGDQGYLLNIKLEAITVDRIDEPQHSLLASLARLVPGQQIGYSQIGGDFQYAEPWTASFKDLTVRSFINRLAEHLGPRSAWVWQGGKNERMFSFFRYGFTPG